MNITGEIWQDYSRGQLGGIHGSQNSFSGCFKFGSKSVQSSCTWENYGDAKSIAFDASRNWTGATSEEGKSQAFNVLQPYISVYIWKRTA